ncbi:Lft1p NDAI_0C00760 [Naumovozyma dairenensis CBS 421]|uniref:Uncharacterized protein n=1 Tax=Naumovozyma dairenensis (strain ATCC 10597 / BCRC 20456 / CBS 421 / NBRC 0211 / NRRL Y-12639) TaxID=1071378 RepID=G0W7H6_NAUDC|nr:hypothetical protein NDAI_0C00760 [Naumovozyma dairenensis CBS 421]CCD23737.1 hypothetical protein NDAI_0C00760 [Naumovozyma dairenensis CBS 421]
MEELLADIFNTNDVERKMLSDEDKTEPKDCNEGEDASLYKLLDEVSGGRKLMSFLFQHHDVTQDSFSTRSWYRRDNPIINKCYDIGEEWLEEEKYASNFQSGNNISMALPIDTPVLFAWSNKGTTTSNKLLKTKQAKGKEEAEDEEDVSRQPQKERKEESTNQKLFKLASIGLKEIVRERDLSSSEMYNTIQGKRQDSNNILIMTNSSTNVYSVGSQDTDKNTSVFGESTFKIDPLQKFVPRGISHTKNADKDGIDHKRTKHKSKGKSSFWFWSSHSKKKNESKGSRHTKDKKEKSPEKAKNGSVPVFALAENDDSENVIFNSEGQSFNEPNSDVKPHIMRQEPRISDNVSELENSKEENAVDDGYDGEGKKDDASESGSEDDFGDFEQGTVASNVNNVQESLESPSLPNSETISFGSTKYNSPSETPTLTETASPPSKPTKPIFPISHNLDTRINSISDFTPLQPKKR